MQRDDNMFLRYVSEYCAEFPEVIPSMIQTMTSSISTRLSSELEKRNAIEAALGMALMRRSRSADSALASKLDQISAFSMLSYGAIIDDLKK